MLRATGVVRGKRWISRETKPRGQAEHKRPERAKHTTTNCFITFVVNRTGLEHEFQRTEKILHHPTPATPWPGRSGAGQNRKAQGSLVLHPPLTRPVRARIQQTIKHCRKNLPLHISSRSSPSREQSRRSSGTSAARPEASVAEPCRQVCWAELRHSPPWRNPRPPPFLPRTDPLNPLNRDLDTCAAPTRNLDAKEIPIGTPRPKPDGRGPPGSPPPSVRDHAGVVLWLSLFLVPAPGKLLERVRVTLINLTKVAKLVRR